MFSACFYSSYLLLVLGAMTSTCQSFVMPRPALVLSSRIVTSLFDSEPQQQQPEQDPQLHEPAVIPESTAADGNDAAAAAAAAANSSYHEETCAFMGIDEDFVPFPHRDFTAPDVVQLCMGMLSNNQCPYVNAGLEVCFNFSSDQCRAAQGGSLEAFIQFANNPIFGSMVNCHEWQVVSTGPVIVGTPTRGAMQTVLVTVVPSSSSSCTRKFLWTLQQERRPPHEGCWLVWECIALDQAYSLTL